MSKKSISVLAILYLLAGVAGFLYVQKMNNDNHEKFNVYREEMIKKQEEAERKSREFTKQREEMLKRANEMLKEQEEVKKRNEEFPKSLKEKWQ